MSKRIQDGCELRPIPNFSDYLISADGRIYSTPRKDHGGKALQGRWLRPSKDKDGYLTVCLSKDGKEYTRKVHRFVLEAYVGPCPEGQECRHLDGDPANNRLGNLQWGTGLENAQDAIRHGTHADNRGERHGLAKLTESIVVLIRQLWNIRWMGVTQTELGEMFNISNKTVSDLVRRRRWKHI